MMNLSRVQFLAHDLLRAFTVGIHITFVSISWAFVYFTAVVYISWTCVNFALIDIDFLFGIADPLLWAEYLLPNSFFDTSILGFIIRAI